MTCEQRDRWAPPVQTWDVLNYARMDNLEPDDDFRSRLSRIPAAEDRRGPDPWAEAAPPVVRRPAPVARPAIPQDRRGDVPTVDPFIPEAAPPDSGGLPPEDQYMAPRRRRWPMVLFGLILIAALLIVVPLYQARRVFNSVERVPVSSALSPPPAGTHILLVGTDSRAGIDADTENAGLILGEGIGGSRTDTIMILRLEEEGSKFLSLPRDLWLPIDGGGEGRINTAFGRGPEAVINTVQMELGVPLSNYVQIDLAGFIDLVDAVGGVDITIPHPAFDTRSGLNLPTAGVVTLDSTQALAFVRSRFYTEIRNGVEVQDPTSDLGRVQRQQDFMRALMQKLTEQRNPLTLNDMATSMADALVMDDGTSMSEALRIADALRTSTPESVVLPTTPTTRGSASVLVLADGSAEVLAQFAG